MITLEHKDIAQWAMKYALSKGCQASRVSIITAKNNSFEFRNTQLDKLHQSTENKLFIEFFVDGRYSSASTNRIKKNELESFISEGILSAKYLAEDKCRQLPNPERYYKNNGRDLDLYDNSFEKIETDQKLEVAKQSLEEIYGTDPRMISASAVYDDGTGAEYMITSNGFESETRDSAFNITVEVSLKTDGDARAEAYWFDSSIYWTDLKTKGIGRTALDRALRKIGQQKIKSGKYQMLLDNTTSARLLSPLISAMYGNALQQKNSFLLNKLNERIVSDKLTILDTPHILKAFGARWFDGEGVATKQQVLIENGILKTYFIDTYNAHKMNVAPTISSPSILSPILGKRDFDDILKSVDKGIWVTGFNGGNCNGTTGDFSFGVEGFLIEKGQVSMPVSEMNITGNILVLWNNLEELGSDPRSNSSRLIPSLLFNDVTFSGL